MNNKKYCFTILFTIFLGLHYSTVAQGADIQILKNNDLENWNDKGMPISWVGKGISKETTIIKDGKLSAKVTGKTGQLAQRAPLEKGKTYRVSGWIYSDNKRSGCIGLRTKDYKWKLKLEGSKQPGKWKFVSKIYTADGTERIFYCFNWYIGKKQSCYYSSPSVIELTEETVAKY